MERDLVMAERLRLMGRNGALWREHCRGATQEALAEKYGVSQATVSNAIRAVADGIPQQERAEIIAQEVDFFRDMRMQLLEVFDQAAAPVTAGKDGDLVRDPATGEYVRDHTGRLNAARMALQYSERMHKLLGLEAAMKLDVGNSEEEAARLAAAQAVAHLHGGDDAQGS